MNKGFLNKEKVLKQIYDHTIGKLNDLPNSVRLIHIILFLFFLTLMIKGDTELREFPQSLAPAVLRPFHLCFLSTTGSDLWWWFRQVNGGRNSRRVRLENTDSRLSV